MGDLNCSKYAEALNENERAELQSLRLEKWIHDKLLVAISDILENSSADYGWDDLLDLIRRKKEAVGMTCEHCNYPVFDTDGEWCSRCHKKLPTRQDTEPEKFELRRMNPHG
jgi:hypothetical protein